MITTLKIVFNEERKNSRTTKFCNIIIKLHKLSISALSDDVLPQGHHPLSEENIASKAAEPLTPASRKRKIWDELESLEVKSLPGELATSTDLQEEPPRVFSTSNSGTLHHLSDLRPPASPIRRYAKPKTPEGKRA